MSDLGDLLEKVYDRLDDPSQGLPQEVFLFASSITPMVNVDLLVRDEIGRVLLSWRDDEYEGTGWHVPGGILRLKETFDERLQRTAEQELGCEVTYNEEPLEIVPIIKTNKNVRCHFISFVYDCRLLSGVMFKQRKQNGQAGFLAWHEHYPDDMLPVHAFYRKYFQG